VVRAPGLRGMAGASIQPQVESAPNSPKPPSAYCTSGPCPVIANTRTLTHPTTQKKPSVQIQLVRELRAARVSALLTGPPVFRFKHSFTTESMIPAIHDVLSCTTPPLYSTIMKIDKKIRTSAYPSKLQFVNLREASMELLMQSQEMLFARDICKFVFLVEGVPLF
jgi:hypothetical protein